jgi:ABC-type nickel/cobalt efflux system permease component RcnA
MTLLPIATAFMLGFLHALEVDHMIAVTTFVTGRPAVLSAARFGFRWGIGHSAAVMVVGAVLLATGVRWPSRYDALGEGLVGFMLIGLGLWALRSGRSLHLHPPEQHGDHAHLHAHQPPHDGNGTAHDHPHPHRDEHVHHDGHEHRHHHRHGVTLVGLLHGLAGSSAAVALVPVTLLGRLDLGLIYLLVFGSGVTLGMVGYAMVAAYAIRRAAGRSVAAGQRLTQGVGVLGVLVGAWWVWTAVF